MKYPQSYAEHTERLADRDRAESDPLSRPSAGGRVGQLSRGLSRQEDLDKLVASLAPAGWSTTDAEEAIYRLFDALPDGDWPMAFDALVAMEVEGWSRAMSGDTGPWKPA